MSKHLKLGLIIFNLVILTAFHRGDALECYVCHGEDDCLKDYPSEICTLDVEETTENDSSTSTDFPTVTSPTTTEAEVSSTTIKNEASSTTTKPSSEAPPSTTQAPSETSSTTPKPSSEVPANTSEAPSETSSTTPKPSSEVPPNTSEAPSETSSTTPKPSSEVPPNTSEAPSETSSTTPKASSEAPPNTTETTSEIPESDQETDGINKSENDNYSVKQLYRGNVKSRRRRFALSTREESWSCFKSVEGEKVIERGCINSDPPKDSPYELCQSDKCNPASSIHLNFTLISMILTLTIAYYIF